MSADRPQAAALLERYRVAASGTLRTTRNAWPMMTIYERFEQVVCPARCLRRPDLRHWTTTKARSIARARSPRWSGMSILPARSSANQGLRFSNLSGSTLAAIAMLEAGAVRLTRVHYRLKQVNERLVNAFRVDTALGPCGDQHLPSSDDHLVGKIWHQSSIGCVH